MLIRTINIIGKGMFLLMQLPRGAFRDIKKGISLESLLAELKEESFSGYCKIASGKASATLVQKKGIIILAQSADLGGNAALAAIGKWRDASVDAVLHDLSETQLELALEFNPTDRVRKAMKAPSPGGSLRDDPKHDASLKGADVNSPAPLSPRHKEPDPKAHQTLSPVLQEFKTLEGMDIEAMSQNFRKNCRQMIEKLDLEFLLEPEKQKGGP
jgi:hypothetical protein